MSAPPPAWMQKVLDHLDSVGRMTKTDLLNYMAAQVPPNVAVGYVESRRLRQLRRQLNDHTLTRRDLPPRIRLPDSDRLVVMAQLSVARLYLRESKRFAKDKDGYYVTKRSLDPHFDKPKERTAQQRTAATKKGWETRRKNGWEPPKFLEVIDPETRRARSRKGWQTRMVKAGRRAVPFETISLPLPGTQEAIRQKCKCPVVANQHGNGWRGPDDEPLFWVEPGCEVHRADYESAAS